MITLRRDAHRHHQRYKGQQMWRTFGPHEREDLPAGGFGILEALNEYLLPPGAAVPGAPGTDAEVLTYVQQGTLAQEDSLGRSGVLQAGEFQRMTARRGVRQSATNPSRTDDARVFQVWLRPSEAGLLQSYEQKRFSVADRRGTLRIVASSDGQQDSLRIHPDALLYSVILELGQHIVHELARGRLAWLHVVSGEIVLADAILSCGDGVGVDAERALSLTARGQAELLLIDIPSSPGSGEVRRDGAARQKGSG